MALRLEVPRTMRTKLWLIVGMTALAAVTAVSAVGATGASGVIGTDKITTIAGIGKFSLGGFSGDGGPANRAELSEPLGVAVDGQGNVYVADYRNHRVRKVSRDGKISTFAGTGTCTFSGDGGPAASASLCSPRGVAVDGQRNVYIVDLGNNRVRKVSAGGTITTVAGGPCRGPTVCAQGDGGPATEAWLSSPWGVAVDVHGNLYIGEYGGQRVRKVSPGGTITTMAGTGKTGFSGDGGPATSAQLHGPAGVAVDGKGNVYIADQQNVRVRKVSPDGKITTFAGTGVNGFAGEGRPATSAQMSGGFGVAVDKKGNVYIADTGVARILKVAGGRLTRVAGRDPRRSGGLGEGGPANQAQMSAPFGVAVDQKGNVYVTDGAYNTVRKVWKGSSTAKAATKKASATGASAFKSGYFKTPSGNIVCFHSPGAKDLPRAFLGCGIKSGLKPAPPRRACQEGGYAGDRVELLATGRVRVPSCAGDPGALVGAGSARVLGYNKTWSGGGLRCTSAFTGLTCRNKSGHGFFLSREHWRSF